MAKTSASSAGSGTPTAGGPVPPAGTTPPPPIGATPPPAPLPPPPPKHKASIVTFPGELPPAFVDGVKKIESLLTREVWLLVENGDFTISSMMYHAFRGHKADIAGKDVALLLDSGGGSAEAAFRIASLFHRQARSFVVIVPRFAKSAATLLSLGASEIILGEDAELGPLDVQFMDYDHEESRVSALDTVQAVEQLEDSAIEVAARMLRYLKGQTRKRYNVLLGPSLNFAAELTKPLFEKIDAVSYSRRSRMLKEAEDYAVRLLTYKFEPKKAKALANDLVKRYSTHEFVIDAEECTRLGVLLDDEGKEQQDRVGLHAKVPTDPAIAEAIEIVYSSISDIDLALGRIQVA